MKQLGTTGLHCYASENYCTFLPCAVTDGSIANTEPCVCGNEECTASRGLICYSTIGGGSCRKNDVDNYKLVYSDTTKFQLFDFLVYTVWACLKGMTPYNALKEKSSQITHYDDNYSAPFSSG